MLKKRARERDRERAKKGRKVSCDVMPSVFNVFFRRIAQDIRLSCGHVPKNVPKHFSLSSHFLSSCLPEDEIVFREFCRNSFQARHDKSFFEMAVAGRLVDSSTVNGMSSTCCTLNSCFIF